MTDKEFEEFKEEYYNTYLNPEIDPYGKSPEDTINEIIAEIKEMIFNILEEYNKKSK